MISKHLTWKYYYKDHGFGIHQIGILFLAFQLTGCMATGKKFNLYTLASLLAKWMMATVPTL
jgi:hypothetical protein